MFVSLRRHWFFGLLLLLAACAPLATEETPAGGQAASAAPVASPTTGRVSQPTVAPMETTAAATEAPALETVPTATSVAINRRVNDDTEYDFPRLLGLDSIAPVYDPEFATAADSPLKEDELVLGVAIDGEAKAYPVTVLRTREMVIDDLAGIPILVTW